MKEMTTLEEILGDFAPAQPTTTETVKSGGPVTIWLPATAKARYDKLQQSSGRRFSKKAREVLLALIEVAEARAG